MSITTLIGDQNTSVAEIGGKAARLGQMLQANINVPLGFVVTAEANQLFLGQNDFLAFADYHLQNCDYRNGKQLAEVSAKILREAAFLEIPSIVDNAIADAYKSLPRLVGLAARSSAINEDRNDASFAGQYESYLNIVTYLQLLTATKDCWLSIWSPRALLYRYLGHSTTTEATMAVIIQEMVYAEVAGVMFTVDPTSNNRDTIVVNSAWGLGDSVASGWLVPDHFAMEKKTGRVIYQNIGRKEKASKPLACGGIASVSVSPALINAPSLTKLQLQDLLRIGMELELLFGCPQDIEWAYTANELFILQSRPITTVNRSFRNDKLGSG